MQQIKTLADNRVNLDFALRKAFSSYQFMKFYSNEESKTPDEIKIWFAANCSQSYKEFLEESTRRVIEEEYGIILKRGAVVPSKTSSFPIVYFEIGNEEREIEVEAPPEEKAVREKAVEQPEVPVIKVKTKQQETRLSIDGWVIYHLRRTNRWKIIDRDAVTNRVELTVNTRQEAISFAQNNLTAAAKKRLEQEIANAEKEMDYVV